MESMYALKRLGQKQTIYTSSDGFIELNSNDFCFIDEETAKTLELVENNVDSANRRHTLFGYLNTNTSTTTGARLLKQAILSPLYNYEVIEHRLDCIEYLVARVDTLATITNCIKCFGQGVDLDSVVPCLVNLFKSSYQTLVMAEKKLDAISTLECLLSQIPSLIATLERAEHPTLNVYKAALQDPSYTVILDEISMVLESTVRLSKGKRGKMFLIKEGVEPLFDLARNTYLDVINKIEQYIVELQKEDGIAWKLGHNVTRGYFLSLATNHLPKNHALGAKYIRVNRNRSLISCTTESLMQMNVRADMSYENSMKLANEVLSSCLASITSHMAAMYKLVDAIGMLDLITCFAKLVNSSNGRLIRPKFTSTDTVIEKSRHPVLETVLNVNNMTVVPNDIMLSTSRQNFMLITGPNMGGKSIYLKQVGIIQIMAQIGCYVPAEKAHIKTVRRLVARSGTSDDSQSSCSSFMWEMKGIASALKLEDGILDHSALYLIDEVGRGTSIDDGASYSFAIAEELALRKYSFTVFATHFDQVFRLSSLYRNVAAYHFKYDEDNGIVDVESKGPKINHNLVPGLAESSHYGIDLAEACGLPDEIIRTARFSSGTGN